MNLCDKKVLCIRPDGMGDVLMTGPAIRSIKDTHPSASVTLLCSRAGSGLATFMPGIDNLLIFNVPWEGETAEARGSSQAAQLLVDKLRRERFDLAIIFTNFSQSPLPSALLAYLSEIPERAAHCRENPQRLISRWIPDPEPQHLVRHSVRRQLDLMKRLGCTPKHERLELALPPEASRQALAVLQSAGLSAPRFLVMHPGCNAASRTYPKEGFIRVGKEMTAAGWTLVLTGSDNELELTQEIAHECGPHAISVAGLLSPAQFAAVLSAASAVIANNTSTIHVAAAANTPVAVLYALTNPEHTPWMVKNRVLFHDVPCKYCYSSPCPMRHHRCLRAVEPEQVALAVAELMDEGSPMSNYGEVLPDPSRRLDLRQAHG